MKGRLFNRMRRMVLLAALAAIMPPLYAQSSMDWRRYRIDYVKESHLLKKGNQLTVVNLNLEWPVRLSGLPTTALQSFLCDMVFDSKASDYDSALASYLAQQGDEIKQMPDDPGLSVRYVNYNLHGLAWEKDKYISMRLVMKWRSNDKEIPDSLANILLTYDIVADKVLRTKDILYKHSFTDIYFTENLVMSIIEGLAEPDLGISNFSEVNSPDDLMWNIMEGREFFSYSDIFFYLPDEACLLPMGLMFNVPWAYDEDGVNPVSIINKDGFISKRALKTMEGKSKPRKDRPMGNNDPSGSADAAVSLDDTLHVYEVVDSMPHYDGDTKDMFLFLKRQVSYPAYEQLLGIEGKVTVSFIVERDGSISSPTVISPVSPGIDRQAVAAVMAMPRWVPGRKNGVAVRARTGVPVTFKLEKQ
ncbi:MAG: energy transducer TonB [Prevotella sp.]|nr:energy transducer TonB [Prevotella sp.]